MTSSSSSVNFSKLRLRAVNDQSLNPHGNYVIYWMIAARRCRWNYALQHAADAAQQLGVGLLVFESLGCDEPHASDRLHRFVIEGMQDNIRELQETSARYYPWVESSPGESSLLLQSMADNACLVVTDEFPANYQSTLVKTASRMIKVRMETVDGNGLLPLAVTEKEYPTAYAFRRFLHKALPAFIDDYPLEEPLAGINLPEVKLPKAIEQSWPAADLKALLAPHGLSILPIDHDVRPVSQTGGSHSAESRLNDFMTKDFQAYPEQRNVPDLDQTSNLSAYLHFGHISSHHIFSRLAELEGWDSSLLGLRPTGKRSGWWGMSETAEAFLDQLVTWRELGYVFCHHRNDADKYTGLPEWASISLDLHRTDTRPYLYSKEVFEKAETHDPLWNAAQRQLLREGRIHGYLRMLWGKKILEWSPDAEMAMQIMIELNDRYALDGRSPNSYSGIGWCLGRFDRAWGPERPIFGKIRYMTSKNTARKVAVKKYLTRYN